MDRPRTIAVANDKGGVGKTTTAAVFAGLLAEERNRVLVIDMDRQATISKKLVVDPSAEGRGRRRTRRVPLSQLTEDAGGGLVEVLKGRQELFQIALPARAAPGVDVVVGGDLLEDLRLELDRADCGDGGYGSLRRALERSAEHWDYVVIDCPPEVRYQMKIALQAAHDVVVPTQCAGNAFGGLGALTNLIANVREHGNPSLNFAGVFALGVPARANRKFRSDFNFLHDTYGDYALNAYVRFCAEVVESDDSPKPVTSFRSRSTAARDYRDVWRELQGRWSWKMEVAA